MEGTKEPESSGVLPAQKNQKNGGSELVLWETLGNYFFWICIPWCNQPSAGHVRSSLWPYGGTTGHPFLKPPPWSSSSRAPLQHPQVAAIGNTKKNLRHTIMGHSSTIYDIDGWIWVVSPAKKIHWWPQGPLPRTETPQRKRWHSWGLRHRLEDSLQQIGKIHPKSRAWVGFFIDSSVFYDSRMIIGLVWSTSGVLPGD